MKISNPIIALLSVITIIVSTALYQIFVPMINKGGGCRRSGFVYHEVCESIIGFDIPMWWHISNYTSVPISIFFGILCGAAVATYLLLKSQNSNDGK